MAEPGSGLDRVLRARRMVRRYRPDPVDPGVLDELLELALRAPSAGFAQGARLLVATDEAVRRGVARACGEEEAVARGLDAWLSVAPVHVLLCTRVASYHERYAEPDKAGSVPPARWAVPFWWVDAGAVLQNLLLLAADRGLAAGFCAVDRAAVAAALEPHGGLPDDWDPVGLVTLGHPRGAWSPVGSAKRPWAPPKTTIRKMASGEAEP